MFWKVSKISWFCEKFNFFEANTRFSGIILKKNGWGDLKRLSDLGGKFQWGRGAQTPVGAAWVVWVFWSKCDISLLILSLKLIVMITAYMWIVNDYLLKLPMKWLHLFGVLSLGPQRSPKGGCVERVSVRHKKSRRRVWAKVVRISINDVPTINFGKRGSVSWT